MADENTVEATAEEIAEAKELGWTDKDGWKGDQSKWVDAKTFLEKGRHVLPIMKQTNDRLRGEVGTLAQRLAAAESAIKAANATIETLQASHEDDLKEQLEAERGRLRAEIAKASREGDHEALAEATDDLTKLNVKVEAKVEKKTEDQQPPAITPEIQQWFKDNPEYTKPRRAALANAVMAEMRAAGDRRTGPEFLDAVAAEVEKELGITRKPNAEGKFEGGGGGGRGGGGGGGGGSDKTYADLPADAKAACDKMAPKLVGPNRKHKDVAAWRKSYVEQYFRE